MRNLKLVLMASVVLGTTAIATMNSAEARHYRRAGMYNDYAVSNPSCGILLPTAQFIYPAADWEPFFRHRLYRYGPILTCMPSIETVSVISVRY